MNTQKQIQQTINELVDQQQSLFERGNQLNELIAFWQNQLAEHKEKQLATVHHTYTDTPMAEEYCGGW